MNLRFARVEYEDDEKDVVIDVDDEFERVEEVLHASVGAVHFAHSPRRHRSRQSFSSDLRSRNARFEHI